MGCISKTNGEVSNKETVFDEKGKERDPLKKKKKAQPSHRLGPRGPTPGMEGKGNKQLRQETGQGTRGPLTRQPGRDWRAGGQWRRRRAPEGLLGDGAGRGGGGAAWGRGAGPHNTVLPAPPTRAAEAPAPRAPRCTHRGRGSVRALSGCGVGRLRFSRSLDPDGRVPARVPSSGPSTNQQRLHFRSPCHSGKWLPEVPPLAAGQAAGRVRLTFPRSPCSLLGALVFNRPCQVTNFVLFLSPT